ncbi:MAG: sugar phosphate isomerase/epimerase family protein [Tepidisphaeraceae bacterium]
MARLSNPLAVQLYTVREQAARDFVATVRQVAQIGYGAVELAGFGNLTDPREVRKALDDAGLAIAGAHVSLESLEADLMGVFDQHQVLGNRTLVVPWIDEARRQDATQWTLIAKLLGMLGQACTERDFTLAYHNHEFEFRMFGGKTALEIILAETDPQLVKIELDVYWTRFAGHDPVQWIRRLGARAPMLHLKDLAAGEEKRFAPIGQGTIDFKGILREASRTGVQWLIVEQDDCYDLPPMDAIARSFSAMRLLLNDSPGRA